MSCTATYTVYKALVYIMLVLRLMVVYDHHTVVNYSRVWLWLWVMALIVSCLGVNVVLAVGSNMHIDAMENVCVFGLQSVALSVGCFTAVQDICVVVVFAYLFVKPLMVIAKRSPDAMSPRAREAIVSIKRVAVKQCLCNLVATGMTLLAAVFIYTFHMTQVFAVIDTVVTSLSMILMFQWHAALYEKCLCRKCERCLLPEQMLTLEMVNTQDEMTGLTLISD